MPDKTILISGASGNLGEAVVAHFINRGNKVIGLVHHQSESPNPSPNYKEVEVNLLDETATEKSIEQLLEIYTQIDTAVLTAGGFAMGNLEKTTSEDLEHQFQLNFNTAFNLARPLLDHMEKRGEGKLFFIGSQPGLDITKGKSVFSYALSKSLLFRMAEMVNADKKYQGIMAHVIVPSTIDTPQNRKAVPDADFSKWEKPEEIAQIIADYADQKNTDKSVIIVSEELGK